MAETNINDRLRFRNSGEQRIFLLKAKLEVGGTWDALAQVVNVHPRTLRDWAREKYAMSLPAAKIIVKETQVPLPRGVGVRKWSEHLTSIGAKGGTIRYKKYGRVALNEAYRQQRWRTWWEATGRYLPSKINNEPLAIDYPGLSEQLAEFVGIVLGDGGLSRLQLTITLHRFDDAAYSQFVRRLILDLFGVKAGKHQDRNFLADKIVVSRVALINFCVEKLGLKVGNKVQQQVDIPEWIKINKSYLIACIRGLVDTDGCIFTHRYKVKGKEYSYKKLSFTSQSLPLKLSVYDCFELLGLRPRMAQESDVRLDSQESVRRYFEVIGSHNPKHLKRYTQ